MQFNSVDTNSRPRIHTAAKLQRPAGSFTTGDQGSYDSIIGASATRATYGVYGTGSTVAVIDTGIDYNNPALGGGFGANAKVIAGYNFASDSPDPMATSSQHGTAVAGLIGSSDRQSPGVAPGVKLVGLRITGAGDTAQLNNIARALQWVVDNHAKYNITVVNISMTDDGNYAHNWFAQDGGVGEQITALIGQLQALNIPVVAATGNNFNGTEGEGFVSIFSGVISVTATDLNGNLLSNAQRLGAATGAGTMTDLAAPGEGLVAPTGDNDNSTVEGTSFATPLVSGAVVLLQEIYQSRFGTLPTVQQVTNWLDRGSNPIYDPVTGLTIDGLNILNAASLIPSAGSRTASANTAKVSPMATDSTSTAAATTISSSTVATVPVSPASETVAQASAPAQPTSPSSTPTPQTASSPAPAAKATQDTEASAQQLTSSSQSPEVEIFVDGQKINLLGSSTHNLVPALSQENLNSLVLAMSTWAAGGGSNHTGLSAASKVQIWSAATSQ
ncbi:MAG: S8 family serine peptidase [Planctomycetaceae bacterium]|nr:S8 family serine peptidase [Planctomycetaceae bacterium]